MITALRNDVCTGTSVTRLEAGDVVPEVKQSGKFLKNNLLQFGLALVVCSANIQDDDIAFRRHDFRLLPCFEHR